MLFRVFVIFSSKFLSIFSSFDARSISEFSKIATSASNCLSWRFCSSLIFDPRLVEAIYI